MCVLRELLPCANALCVPVERVRVACCVVRVRVLVHGAWCVVRGAWCVGRGAWCVGRGACACACAWVVHVRVRGAFVGTCASES